MSRGRRGGHKERARKAREKAYKGPNLLPTLPPELREKIFKMVDPPAEDVVVPIETKRVEVLPPWNDKWSYERKLTEMKKIDALRKIALHEQPSKKGDRSNPLFALIRVNKQTYREALPHLFASVTFSFRDAKATEEFVVKWPVECIRAIRKVEVHIRGTPRDSAMCNLITAWMPNIEDLTIKFFDPIVNIKYLPEAYGSGANTNAKAALSQFTALRNVHELAVKVMWFNKWSFWFEIEDDLVAEAVKNAARTGDRDAFGLARRRYCAKMKIKWVDVSGGIFNDPLRRWRNAIVGPIVR